MGNAAFTPSFTDYKDLKPFRFWCQKVLPTVYDDSLSYYELLGKVVEYLNDMIDDMEAIESNTDAILDAFNQLQEYVNEYLGGEEFEEQLDAAVDAFFASEEFTTELTTLVNTAVVNPVEEWLQSRLDTTDIALDESMSIYGAAADAGQVGSTLIKNEAATSDLFEQGTINITTGANQNYSRTIRTKDYLTVADAISLSVATGYEMIIFGYSGDNYIGWYKVSSGSFTLNEPTAPGETWVENFVIGMFPAYKVRVVIESDDGVSSVSPSDANKVTFRKVKKVDETLIYQFGVARDYSDVTSLSISTPNDIKEFMAKVESHTAAIICGFYQNNN